MPVYKPASKEESAEGNMSQPRESVYSSQHGSLCGLSPSLVTPVKASEVRIERQAEAPSYCQESGSEQYCNVMQPKVARQPTRAGTSNLSQEILRELLLSIPCLNEPSE